MKYSIILPVYKIEENELRQCLDSLLNNRPNNVELILIDDNENKDKSGEVCDEYADNNENIVSVHQVNQGVSVARNHGLSLAKGEYIIFVDPDDWVTNDFYSQLERTVNSYGKSDIILFASWVNYPKREIKNSFWNESRVFKNSEKELLQLQLIAKGVTSYFPPEIGVGVPWARVYRKSFLAKNNLFFLQKLKRMQDNIFNMYAFEYANEIVYVDTPIYHYRKSMNSVTNKKNNKVVYHFELVNDEVERFIDLFNKDQIFKDALHIKRLIGINSYYLLYFRFYQTKAEYKELAEEFKELLSRPEYDESLKLVKYRHLLPKERVFVSVLKTRNLRFFVILQKLEKYLKRFKRRDFDK